MIKDALNHLVDYGNQHDIRVKKLMVDIGPVVGIKVVELLNLRHISILSQLRYEKDTVPQLQGALEELEGLINDFKKL